MFFISDAVAHGGGLDSNGGHNCYVGKCAGSYHFHRSGGSQKDFFSDNFGLILFLVFLVAVYLQLRKDRKTSHQHTIFKEDPVAHILEPLGIDVGSHQYTGSEDEKMISRYGANLIDLIRCVESLELRDKYMKILEQCIYLQSHADLDSLYFRSRNKSINNLDCQSAVSQNNVELYVISSITKDEIISVEFIKDGKSEGFLHPTVTRLIDNKMFEFDNHKNWQNLDDFEEITFDEFSSLWKKRVSLHQDTEWSKWLDEYLLKDYFGTPH